MQLNEQRERVDDDDVGAGGESGRFWNGGWGADIESGPRVFENVAFGQGGQGGVDGRVDAVGEMAGPHCHSHSRTPSDSQTNGIEQKNQRSDLGTLTATVVSWDIPATEAILMASRAA